MPEIQIKRRKIQARQFIQSKEGKVKFLTPQGYKRAEDRAYIIELEDGNFTFIPELAMKFLTTKDEDGSKA